MIDAEGQKYTLAHAAGSRPHLDSAAACALSMIASEPGEPEEPTRLPVQSFQEGLAVEPSEPGDVQLFRRGASPLPPRLHFAQTEAATLKMGRSPTFQLPARAVPMVLRLTRHHLGLSLSQCFMSLSRPCVFVTHFCWSALELGHNGGPGNVKKSQNGESFEADSRGCRHAFAIATFR